MADDDVDELERMLGDLKRQLPEGHALAAVIADEELDFKQVTELTLGELSQACIGPSSVVSCSSPLHVLFRMGPTSVNEPSRSVPLVARLCAS